MKLKRGLIAIISIILTLDLMRAKVAVRITNVNESEIGKNNNTLNLTQDNEVEMKVKPDIEKQNFLNILGIIIIFAIVVWFCMEVHELL